MNEKEQFKLMQSKSGGVELIWPSSVASQNKESKQKKHEKETKEMLMNVFSAQMWQTPLKIPILRKSILTTIWNGSCSTVISLRGVKRKDKLFCKM